MGRIDEARTLVEHLRGIGAEIVPTHSPYARNPAQNELFLSGLRLAVGETE
jgi:hypothetical protein